MKFSGVILGLLLGTGSHAFSVAAESSASLLVFLPDRVVWVSLELDGHQIRAAREEYANRVFTSRDQNRDGHLDSIEANRLAVWSAELRQLQTVGSDWKTADVDPRDGQLSGTEWRSYLFRNFGPAMRISVDDRTVRQTGILFSLVDSDRNEMLSPMELQGALIPLLRCDFDNDESISASELAELQMPDRRSALVEFKTAPFWVMSDVEQTAVGVREIVQRYGQASGVPRNVVSGVQAVADRDQNGFYSEDELLTAESVRKTYPQLLVSYVSRREGVRWLEGAATSRSPRRTHAVELGGSSFEIRFQNHGLLEQIQRRELTTEFATADQDDNDYLSALEFSSLVTEMKAEFAPEAALADTDGNGQITREELNLLIDLHDLAIRCQLQWTVHRESKSLFDVLDQSGDRRLSAWELVQSTQRIAGQDRNGDGQLAISELPGQLSLLVGLASPRAEEHVRPVSRRNGEALRRVPVGQGPIWFQRMDRNTDKSVSWREFPGSRDQFDDLDQNRDGVLSLIEVSDLSMP